MEPTTGDGLAITEVIKTFDGWLIFQAEQLVYIYNIFIL
jgi:hypothetical protein